MNKFAKNLKAFRLQNELTQDALAKNLNVSEATVSHWESGKREPNIDMILIIAAYFKISADELLKD